MKEIKFRAWDECDTKMRLVKSVNYADDGFAKTILVHLVGGIKTGYVHGESCELMQWTGLTDIKGKEIYEGDIVMYWGGTAPVVYKAPQFSIKHKENDLFYIGANVVVIGNIYENPELINS